MKKKFILLISTIGYIGFYIYYITSIKISQIELKSILCLIDGIKDKRSEQIINTFSQNKLYILNKPNIFMNFLLCVCLFIIVYEFYNISKQNNELLKEIRKYQDEYQEEDMQEHRGTQLMISEK